MTLSAPWFEERPERLERELEDLKEVGARWVIDAQAQENGVLRLSTLNWPLDGGFELAVVFPDFYPYFRPEVRALSVQLPRHQAPDHGFLCLLNRDTRNWDVDYTLAAYLKERLPLVVRAATTADEQEASGLEEHQGEPVSDYLPYLGVAMLMVDGAWTIPAEATHGTLVLGVDAAQSARNGVLRGAVLEVRDHQDNLLGEAVRGMRLVFTHELRGRWARVPMMPFSPDPAKVVEDLLKVTPQARFGELQPCGDTRVSVLGFLYKEEVGYQRQADSWLFALQRDV